jgi:hypothetical protein
MASLNEIPLLGHSSLKTNYCTVKGVGCFIDDREIDRQSTNIISRGLRIEENPSIVRISI